jgi:serine/threonine-protein kinase
MFELGQVHAGTVFSGRYRVDRLLKAGGMGAVYVAEHTTTRKRVALKLMRPEIVASESARARFVQEAQASAMIESGNVVDVYDAGVDAETNVPFIVMELLVGNELGELVQERGRLSAAEVVDYVAQTARALDRAHAAGVIHRDLKPDNLFLAVRDGEPPRVKVLDFGIAKFLASAGAETTRAAGTPLYMAPEQTRRGANIGPHTDVWALGLIAYTLLVGRPYWEGEDIHEIFGEILGGAHEPPSARAARSGVTLSPAFDTWFFLCVASDPAARFGRAGDAAAALAEALGIQLRSSLSSSDPSFGAAAGAPGQPGMALPSHPALERTSAPDAIVTPAPLRGGVRTLEEASTIGDLGDLRAAPVPHGTPAPLAAPARPEAALAAPAGNTTVAPVAAPLAAATPRARALAMAFGAVLALGAGGFAAYRTLGPRGGPAAVKAPVAFALGLADSTCALDAEGAVRCVGASFLPKAGGPKPEPLPLPGPATALALGKHHGCARLLDSTVACWGQNETGQLGDGTERPHPPAAVPGLRNVEQLALNIHGGCVRISQGRVRCWGGNKYGQVGDGSSTTRLAPVDVEGAQGALSISLGQDHACAVFGDGGVRCWGRNAEGELGTGDHVDRATPTPVVGLEGAVGIALGGHFSCAIVRDGTARCWGSNSDGELGDGTSASSRQEPVQVAGLEGVRQIAAGWRHACARLKGGGLRCWGQNTFGQLGDGTTTNRSVPVPVDGNFTQVFAGRMHTCALRAEGPATCWGRNEEGELGDGTTQNRLTPVPAVW